MGVRHYFLANHVIYVYVVAQILHNVYGALATMPVVDVVEARGSKLFVLCDTAQYSTNCVSQPSSQYFVLVSFI